MINFHSIKNKQAELQAFLVAYNVNIIISTEFHLDCSVLNSKIFSSHYQVYCKDRNIHGAGVFVLVDNNIPSSQVMIDSSCEVVWVQIHSQNHCSMIIGSFYCPPQSPVLVWDDLALCVCQLRQKCPDIPLLLGGNFNRPGIDWDTGGLTELHLPLLFQESLIEFAHDFLLEQIILEPIRGDNNLDLCFTSHPGSIHHYKIVPSRSDHNAVIIEILCNIPISKRLK